jgi:hypothetical protein
LFIGAATEAADRRVVRVDHGRVRIGSEKCQDGTGVVVVAVAQDEGVGAGEIDAEGGCVGDERRPLAGVEEETFFAAIDPRGEAVFGHHIGRGFVVDDEGDRDRRGHGLSVSG